MKIGIITHHTVINQGAVLQMYALKKWLENKGHSVYILKYTKDFDFAPQEAGKYNLSLRHIPFYLKEYVFKKGIGLSWFNVKKQLMYKKYIKSNFSFLSYALDQTDIAIIGSDEVFSLANGCNMMMYGHGVNSSHLISYAPSFGQTDLCRIDSFNCRELIASGLKKFDSLSVRDTYSADIVKTLTGIDPQIVCDPVILYDFSSEHTDISKFGLNNKKYLLVYSMDRWMSTPSESSEIKKYADKKGYITVSAGTYHKWCDKNIVCNPLEWLGIFKGAAEVVTDTFHGSVLSIITNKPTAYYIRNLNTNKLTSLYKYFGLENRVLSAITCEELQRINGVKPDFTMLNDRIKEIRTESENYLISALNNIQEEVSHAR